MSILPLLALLSLAPAAGSPTCLDLPALLRLSIEQASAVAAGAQAQRAQARAEEVRRLWIPRIEISTAGGPSPTIRCVPSTAECIATTPSNLQIGFGGAFYRIDARLEMPLFTFGKLTAGREASAAGARAGAAQAVQAQHAAAMDAARAYFAVKLGRELLLMLEEGRSKVQAEVNRQARALRDGQGEVTEADYRRLLTLLAEIEARTAEARRVEGSGLAGVHYVTGEADLDVDSDPLLPFAFSLPERRAVRRAAEKRPERQAARAGAEAALRLAELERAGWWPDLILIGGGTLARSTSVDHPHHAFMVDPFNMTSGLLGLYLRWSPELGVRAAKVAGAEAEQARAEATVRMAQDGTAAEAERAWAEAQDARDRLAAARRGERHSQAWLTSLVQAEVAGLVESSDLADALMQYFMMRARSLQATFDWNVGVMAVQRTTGNLPQAGPYATEDEA